VLLTTGSSANSESRLRVSLSYEYRNPDPALLPWFSRDSCQGPEQRLQRTFCRTP